MERSHGQSTPRVVIAGGGVAALEAALALRDWLGDSVGLELLSPHEGFVYRPLAVARPFGLVAEFELDLNAFARDTGATLHRGELATVDPAARTAATAGGSVFEFDHLVVATGAKTLPWLEDSLTFAGPRSVGDYRRLLYQLERGVIGSLAFAVPDGPGWLLPIYELALMTAVFARARLCQPRLTLVTPEARPLSLFGTETGRDVERTLEEWGVDLIPEHQATRFERPWLETDRGFDVAADEVVSMPRLRGPGIPGLPADGHGFIEVSRHGEVSGCDGLFAAGDATTFPIKHGGIAAQQADAVAEAIAARHDLIAEPSPFHPTLDAVLLSGETASHLHRALSTGATHPPVEQVGETWLPLGKVAARHLGSYLADRAGVGSTSPGLEPDELARELRGTHERRFRARVESDR
jgi:sulfide:quinone oxidoreductase